MVQQVRTVCDRCNGTGEDMKERLETAWDSAAWVNRRLADCWRVAGEIWAKKDICAKCNGKKLSQERKILDVHVDKGMRNDQKVGCPSVGRRGLE